MSEVTTAVQPAATTQAAPQPQLVQRRCACGGVPGPTGECAECRAKRLGLQRAAASPGPAPCAGHVPRAVAGRPLDSATRSAMETAFGHDFGRVRVHTDVGGGRAADELGAHAYTVGSDIYFAAGRYEPGRPAGARLLAHELAHTIHQRGAAAVQPATAIDLPGSPLELEADRAAEAVLAGRPARIRGRLAHRARQRQASGDALTRTRTIPGGRIDVTRRLEPQPCTRAAQTQPRSEVYLDREAEAFGLRFGFCRGNTDVDVDNAIRYGNLLQQARDLAQSVPQTALSGGDPLGAIETAVRGGTITGQTTVTATVSGVLVAQVSGSTTQGLQERSYEVSGLLRIAPGGSWALELGGQYSHIVSDLGGTTTRIRFTPRADLGPVQLGVSVEHTQTQPGGGPAAPATTSVSGTASIPFGRSGVGINITGSSEGGGSFSITFGTVERREAIPRVRSVECYTCDCPPPRPRYTCTRVIEAHPGEPRETQAAGHQVVRLHYQYDNSDPASPTEYATQVQGVVGLIHQNYTVRSITGYASPEASNPTHNVALSQRRADAARTAISDALMDVSGTALPTAVGAGELYGQRTRGETPDAQLIAELTALLAPLGPDERLDLLAADRTRLSADERAAALARIDAFLSGREGGRALTTRLRWEKIFPYLRRADVELDRPRLTEPTTVPRQVTTGDCDAETLAWARGAFPALRPEQRTPGIGGRC